MLKLSSLLLLLATVCATASADTVKEFECPQGSYITQLSGYYGDNIKGIKAECGDSVKTKSIVYGSSNGVSFQLPYAKDGITKVFTRMGTYVDSIGYDGLMAGSNYGSREMEFADLNGCAVVGFEATFRTDVVTNLRFKFGCVNKPVVISSTEFRLTQTSLSPRNCDMCTAPMSIQDPSAKLVYMAKVLSRYNPRFYHAPNAYALAYSLEKGSQDGNLYASQLMDLLVAADRTRGMNLEMRRLIEYLSRGRFSACPNDYWFFQQATEYYYTSCVSRVPMPASDSNYYNYNQIPYCDHVASQTVASVTTATVAVCADMPAPVNGTDIQYIRIGSVDKCSKPTPVAASIETTSTVCASTTAAAATIPTNIVGIKYDPNGWKWDDVRQQAQSQCSR